MLAIINYDSKEFQQLSRAYTYSMPQGLESVNKNTKENTHTCVSAHTVLKYYIV